MTLRPCHFFSLFLVDCAHWFRRVVKKKTTNSWSCSSTLPKPRKPIRTVCRSYDCVSYNKRHVSNLYFFCAWKRRAFWSKGHGLRAAACHPSQAGLIVGRAINLMYSGVNHGINPAQRSGNVWVTSPSYMINDLNSVHKSDRILKLDWGEIACTLSTVWVKSYSPFEYSKTTDKR